jgi:hypothetical protein
MITGISEIVHEWTGWCPKKSLQGANQRPDISETSVSASPDQRQSPAVGIPGVIAEEKYRNRQISYFFTAGMIVMIITCIYNSLTYHLVLPSILFAILAPLGWLVSASLTVRIYDNLLEIRKGPVSLGLNTRKIPLTEIELVRMEERPGERAIRYFIARADPRKFRSGVTIELTDGKTIRIGTDEPEILMQAINDAIADAAKEHLRGEPS